MMEQYIEIKSANPDMLLFYRMGDFYELFFEDAETASRALGITLTKRGKHLGEDIPMCGVPVHSAEDYLHRLISLGHRVAVCEQTEDPAEARKRGSKAVVRRDVRRLVTPGTITEDKLLDPVRSNFLAALARIRLGESSQELALAWVDLSTGAFSVCSTSRNSLTADIARIEPSEIIVSDKLFSDEQFRTPLEEGGAAISVQPQTVFDSSAATERLQAYFKVNTLESFGQFTRVEAAAAGALLAYLEKTQLGERPVLQRPIREEASRTLFIDAATRTNLELTKTMSGERNGSLLKSIDRTVTGAGARLLGQRLMNPLAVPEPILQRLDSVSFMTDHSDLSDQIRLLLKSCPDIQRALSRLALNRGGPRDMAAIGAGLELATSLEHMIDKHLEGASLPDELDQAMADLVRAPEKLMNELDRALADELPLLSRDGGFVRSEYNAELDEFRALRDESRRVIASMQAQYAEETGVKSLKIKFNNVLGYFIEVTALNSGPLTSEEAKARFIHRQTLANAMRFTTTELAETETRIANAAGRALAIEQEIFERLQTEILEQSEAISLVANALALLDVCQSLARLATEQDYCRPKVDDSLDFHVVGGRHPVVEQALRREGSVPFIANDCNIGPQDELEDGSIWLLTGPNMGGKSTFLRQNALIAILAQMGSFVPAKSAHIGVIDRLFSRVGAADDLARGRSTFMVEMIETAAILNQAGRRSFVILDEIGRGTATFDGLSIAWSAIEHLHEANFCRTLFATHYHELTALSEVLPRLSNVTMKVKEWQGDVIFLHEVAPGSADRSYGIQVARLAGLPDAVIARARDVLDQLENADRAKPVSAMIDDLPLFSVKQEQPPQSPQVESEVVQALEEISPDELTPRQALETLYTLQALVRKNNS
ncbi:MAG: DNA mismatch repair protein MutS [Rhizobiaceae bacterium]